MLGCCEMLQEPFKERFDFYQGASRAKATQQARMVRHQSVISFVSPDCSLKVQSLGGSNDIRPALVCTYERPRAQRPLKIPK
jgi:hypothetical protein